MLFEFRILKSLIKTHSNGKKINTFARPRLSYQNKIPYNNSTQQHRLEVPVPVIHRSETMQQVPVGRFGRIWAPPHVYCLIRLSTSGRMLNSE